jgi:hypothetical protein
MNEHEFICDLCDSKKLHNAAKGHVPPGWIMKRINETVVQLCNACGNPAHFAGGPSSKIQQLYEKKFGEKITHC